MANVKVPALLYKMSKASQKAWYKKNNMKMPDEPVERSAAAAKRVKVAPRKASDVKPDSVRAINTARMAAYMAKGGRAPIGAAGSGGNSVMAGSNMSTVRGIITGIKAGFNPTVSLDPYESERAKKTGPRSLKLKKEEVEQVDEGSKRMSAAVKLQRAFEREKTASDTSRERGKEILAQARAEYAKKQAAKTNEEVEQVDEISTPTMSSYVKKVGAENKFTKKRVDGLNLALNKIKSNSIKKKEVEQVDEISNRAKHRYMGSAAADLTSRSLDHGAMSGKKGYRGSDLAKDQGRRIMSRQMGIARVADTLVKKEEAEQVDENLPLLPKQKQIASDLLKKEMEARKKQRNDNRQAGTPKITENNIRDANNEVRRHIMSTPRLVDKADTLKKMKSMLQSVNKHDNVGS